MSITAYEQITTAPENGPQGPPGPIPYPAGKWEGGIPYVRTKTSTPVVLYEDKKKEIKEYFILMADGESLNENPFTDYEKNLQNAKWHLFDKYKHIFTEVLMADYALLAGAVAHENRLFSQKGTLNGEEKSDESSFTDTSFKPHLDLNWLTGKLTCNDADIAGKIDAKEGTIGGFKIEDNSIVAGNGTLLKEITITTGYILLGKRVSNSTPHILLGLTTDSESMAGSIVSMNAGNYETCMKIHMQPLGGDQRYTALNIGFGNINDFSSDNCAINISRGYIRGFGLYTQYIQNSTTLSSSDNVVIINATYENATIKLPVIPNYGQVIFIKRIGGSKGVTIDGNSRKLVGTNNYDSSGKTLTLTGSNIYMFVLCNCTPAESYWSYGCLTL